MAIQELKIKDISPGENYRRHMDKTGMKELTASVKSHGVLQPIIVRKMKKGYEIIAGHRRHTAALAAGLKTIPASIVTADDAAALEIAVIENTQREDPNPMDEALGFKRLLDLGKHSVESLAKKLDKSQAYVYTRLRLNELPKDAQKALLNDEITLGHAIVLERLATKQDAEELLRDILDQSMSVSDARDYLRGYSTDLDAAPFDKSGCDKCFNRTRTQAALFPDAKDDDDRCMDRACYFGKVRAHLDSVADKHRIRGIEVITDPAIIDKLTHYNAKTSLRIYDDTQKDYGTHPKKWKSRCQAPCASLAFFIQQKTEGGKVESGWICRNKACFEEMQYGKKPTVSSAGQPADNPKTSVSREQSDAILKMRDEFMEGMLLAALEPSPAAGELSDAQAMRLRWLAMTTVTHLDDDQMEALLKEFGAETPEEYDGWYEDHILYKALQTVPKDRLQGLVDYITAERIAKREEFPTMLLMLADLGISFEKDFVITRSWLETLKEKELFSLGEEFGIPMAEWKTSSKTMLIEVILAGDIKGKIPSAMREFLDPEDY